MKDSELGPRVVGVCAAAPFFWVTDAGGGTLEKGSTEDGRVPAAARGVFRDGEIEEDLRLPPRLREEVRGLASLVEPPLTSVLRRYRDDVVRMVGPAVTCSLLLPSALLSSARSQGHCVKGALGLAPCASLPTPPLSGAPPR